MNVYLPIINHEKVSAQKNEELDLFSLVCTDPAQQRCAIVLDECLCKAARFRCEDMAARCYFNHTDPDGITPNQRSWERGCPLPSYYSVDNNIESIAAGYTTVRAVWDGWKNSPAHRTHVLGEHEFFRGQVRCGIGYHYSEQTPYWHYWTIWFAHVADEAGAASIHEIVEISGGICL